MQAMLLICPRMHAGESAQHVEGLVQGQLLALQQSGVTAGEMARVRRTSRFNLLTITQSNSSMASALASYHVLTGGWLEWGSGRP